MTDSRNPQDPNDDVLLQHFRQHTRGEPPASLDAFILAAALKCPIYLVFGLYTAPNRYDLFCEPFVDQLVLPRHDREGALRDAVIRYAERLESYARRAPDNWFNFFDFWETPPR